MWSSIYDHLSECHRLLIGAVGAVIAQLPAAAIIAVLLWVAFGGWLNPG